MSDQEKPSLIECRLCRKNKKYVTPYSYDRFKNEIEPWAKVCTDCVELWEIGKRAAKASKEEGKPVQAYVHREVPVNAKMGKADGSVEVKGSDIIAAMGAIKLRGTEAGKGLSFKHDRIKIVEVQDEKDWQYVGGQTEVVQVPQSRAAAMKRIFAAFYNAIAKARVDGYNEGRNLLAGLAKGEVRLDDFEERCDNVRAGKKPTSRWGD